MALIMKFSVWPRGVVPFTIDPALPDQARVAQAIAHWEANTNLRFRARTAEPNFITFMEESNPANHCQTVVGHQGAGEQFVLLAAGCATGQVIHEIGHAVGMVHEHMRLDRDEFIEVFEGNIIERFKHNFIRACHDCHLHGQFGCITCGVEYRILHYFTAAYDYLSIMHYARDTFARGASDTIRTFDPYFQDKIGQRVGLSDYDRAGINAVYQGFVTFWPTPS